MPLFKCTKCGCVENTALGYYWSNPKAAQCSECFTGTWHGRFDKELAGECGWVPDEPQFPQFLRQDATP